MMPAPQRMRGFTLLEILVALAIFALLAAMAFRGLTLLLDTRQQVTASGDKWQQLARLHSRLKQDFASVALRNLRDTRGVEIASFVAEPNPVAEDAALLSFSRMGLAGQGGSLQNLQRIGYRLRNQRLEMLTWSSLDQAPRARPQVEVVFEGVQSLQSRYLDMGGQWRDYWPLANQASMPPLAVQWQLTLLDGSRLDWRWSVR